MEFADTGDLLTEAASYADKMPEAEMRYYALQISYGLKYLHSQDIKHNDLSRRNVVLKFNCDGSKKAMITDFGSSQFVTEAMRGADCFCNDVAMFTQVIIGMHFVNHWEVVYRSAHEARCDRKSLLTPVVAAPFKRTSEPVSRQSREIFRSQLCHRSI